MNKRILYVGFYALPDKDAAANRVMNNANALRDYGDNIVFIDEQDTDQYTNIDDSYHIVSNYDVWTYKRPKSIRGFVSKMTSINHIVQIIKKYKRIDVVIAYNYPSIALLKLKSYCRKHSIILVSDCTEWYSGKEYRFPKNMLSSVDSFLRMRIIQKQIDGVICISTFLSKYYSKQRNIIIPPLVDANQNIWKQDSLEYSKEVANIVYAGNPGKSKENIVAVFEAIDKMQRKDILFRIVGISKSDMIKIAPNIESVLERINCCVEFMGRKSHTETVQIISSSDYMIFMREKNRVSDAGFSTKFVESITCGTPVITTDTGDLKRIIDKNKCGIIVQKYEELPRVLENICERKQNTLEKELFYTQIFDYRDYMNKLGAWIDDFV